jgi:adenylate cyclase
MKNATHKKVRRLNPLGEARSLVLCCGLIITLATASLVFNPTQTLNFLNLRVYDFLLSAAPLSVPSDVPILVGIDDQSLEAYGQWPWPRYRLALLVSKLKQAGVEVVALDMLMPEADRTSPEVILHERQRDLGELQQHIEALDVIEKSNDLLLAEALAQVPSALSYKFLFTEDALAGGATSLVPLSNIVIQQGEGGGQLWPAPDSVLNSLAVFRAAASASGFTNVQADSDNVLRRVPLLMAYRGQYYPSLALAALRLVKGEMGMRLTNEEHESLLQWGDKNIPLDEQGRLLLSYYRQEKPFAYYSAADVLSGQISEGRLAGKIAFVGAWASGLGDRHGTPLGTTRPGLELHAVITSNLLSGNFLQQPAWARGAELFFVLALGILSTLLITRFGFFTNLFLFVVGAVFPLGGASVVFSSAGIYIPPVAPLLVLIVNCSLLGIVRYGIEVHKVHKRTRDLVDAQDSTILGMISLSTTRDEETGEHILRTQLYVKTLAQQLRTTESYRRDLEDEDIELLFMSAPLHDIGKVGIPDSILRKPGKLTAEEYEVMKTHPLIGEKALAQAIKPTVSKQGGAYLDYARDVVISHHEKWDGSGYPGGLTGQDIPLAGRLMALADVYDALISARVYKPAFPHEKAKRLIMEGRGKHFDPDVVDAFLATEDEFTDIAAKYSEVPEEGAV